MGHSQEVRDQFLMFYAQGKSIEDIKSNYLPGVGKSTMDLWLKKIKETGNNRPGKSPGRPLKHSDREIRNLKRNALQNPKWSIGKLLDVTGIDACHKTAVKILKKYNLHSFKMKKVPLLTREHARNRLLFAQRHLEKTLDDWKLWTFSDESTIELDCSEGVQRVICYPEDRLLPENVIGKKQMGGGKLMIWSFISWDGPGPLIFIEGGIDGQGYKRLLNSYALPHLLEKLGENGVPQTYMDDGASCHDCELVVDFCAAKGIQRTNWPARSPDMNPIEHVWGWIKHRLTNLEVKPKNIRELKIIITEIWNELTIDSIQKLYSGMPKRIEELNRVGGWNTKF